MTVVSAGTYVPIVLIKMGERSALKDLDETVKDRLVPIFVVPPVDWNFDEEKPAKSVGDHLAKLPEQLAKAWGTRRAFVDLQLVEDAAVGTGGEHPLEWFTRISATFGLALAPVTSIERSNAHRQAAADAVARDQQGACIRLTLSEWPSNTGTAPLDDLMAQLGLEPSQLDLVLDLEDNVGDLALTVVRSELAALPYLNEWGSLTLVGAAMPATMPAGKGTHALPRKDWALWRALVDGPVQPARRPTFGDYVVSGVESTLDVNPRILSFSATLRYATEREWLVAKGGLYKGSAGKGIGGAAMYPVADALGNHPDFMPDHCGFERWVMVNATGGDTGGSPTTWRRYATQHHLQFVTEQLANLPGTSTAP